MIKLSRRLKFVADEIGSVDTFADIGTDHAHLIIYALQKGIAKSAIAVDISEKSLQKAQYNVQQANFGNKVSFVCADGLHGLTTVPDVIVIAGIGGNEIVKILSEKVIATKYVLVPHQEARILREYLVSHGYKLVKDYVVQDGKYYSIIVAEPGFCEYNKSMFILGANNPATEDFVRRVINRKREIDEVLKTNDTTIDCLKDEIREEYEECTKWLLLQKL